MDGSDARGQLELFAEVIGEWQRRLLQLDRRNNSLYFKTEGKTAVGIPEFNADSINHELQSARRSLTFDYVTPKSWRRAEPFLQNPEEDTLSGESRVIRGVLRGNCPPDELQRRLVNLRRRAREWQEGQG